MGRDLMLFLANVVLQVCYAGMNITSMLAMQSGMHPLILVAYRQIFATMAIAPFAYFLEWRTRPRITMPILFQIFLCSLTGALGNQVLYFLGLKESTPTIGCALTNTLPAFTFILAVLFRQEYVGIKTRPGQAKVLGTILCVGGALLLSFYHGNAIDIGESSIHWKYGENMEKKSSSTSTGQGNFILGPFLLICSSLSWAMWFILQARMGQRFPAPYTTTTLMCFMASIECGIIALISKHNASAWSLSDPMRIIASLYAGVVCSALGFALTSWAIQMKGPLYGSVFNPLSLVIVAISSWALLREELHVGTALGSCFIVMGLYAVLWGKNKEIMRPMSTTAIHEDQTASRKLDDDDDNLVEIKDDLELQSNPTSNGNHHVTTGNQEKHMNDIKL
ncbi:WAT1-related protein At1g09380-like [Juglans microcarpa x Juglans regia]|uniref:WAT1-related protein At1g09380-like n=1 Tax=Juglans microcarpa x Juglans regia TaxID=2249226 RepID=UPI001B7DE80A|nr:WAT1-related protein At1g09380-like [Juglans microcarpa x Juglans regia]